MEDGDGTTLTTAATGDTGAVGDTATQNGNSNSFLNSLPETIRGNEVISKFADAGQMAQAHLDMLQRIPVIPETPDAYKITVPEDMPINEERMTAFKQFAHSAGLTQDHVDKIIQYETTNQQEISEKRAVAKADRETRRAQATEASINELKSEWGINYNLNIETAKTAVKKFGDEKFVEFINKTQLGNNPHFIRFMHGIGKAISEDSFVPGRSMAPLNTEMRRTAAGTPELKFPNTPGMN